MNLGKFSYGDPEVFWESDDSELIIGSFCSIAEGCRIFLGGNHRTDWVTTFPFGHIYKNNFNSFNGEGHPATKGSVVIGNDVWIGGNVTIMSGVCIGSGAVVGNNSHVVKDVDPYSIVGGNPAKHIKFRFNPNQIDNLLSIKWWDWPEEKINANLDLLCSSNIDDFISHHS
jgi:acetyltransferase-like isoleucine patch superfamily enzyme